MELDVKQVAENINKSIEGFKEELKGKASSADLKGLEAKLEKIQDSVTTLSTIEGKSATEYVKELQKHTNALETMVKEIKDSRGIREKSVADQIEEVLAKKDAGLLTKGFEVKSAITTSGNFTETDDKIIPAYHDFMVGINPRRNVVLWNLCSKKAIGNTDQVTTLYRSSQTYNAARRAEGAIMGESSASWTSEKWPVENVSAYVPVSRQKLEDTDFIMSEIMGMLQNELPYKLESYLHTGTGSSQPYGIIGATKYAAFAKPTGVDAVTDASNWDVLRTAIAQVMIGNTSDAQAQGFIANGILLHPADIANLHFKKDSNNNYVLPTFVTPDGKTVSGVTIYPDMSMTAGTFLVGDFSTVDVYIRKNLEIKMWDQNSTDPIYDLVTFTANTRVAYAHKNPTTYAKVYGTFSTSREAISI